MYDWYKDAYEQINNCGQQPDGPWAGVSQGETLVVSDILSTHARENGLKQHLRKNILLISKMS